MSNFCLASKGCLVNDYKATKENAGYSMSGCFVEKNATYISFHKYAFKNDNYLSIGSDFIGIIGTLIYKGTTENMLSRVYNDWCDNIYAIRENSIGSYCVIIKKGNLITIFGEENYMYNIYYYLTDNKFIVSNSFFDIQSVLENELEIDSFNFLEMAFNTYVLGNETIFKDVKRLCGDEYISIDLENKIGKIERLTINWGFNKDLNYNDKIKTLTDNLIKKTKIICDVYGTPALSMTGGLDSRLCIAPVLANGVKPDLYYGVGNSILTDTKEMDLKINQMYSKKFGLRLDVMNWSTAMPIDIEWKKYFDRYSESFVQYNASPFIYEALENVPNHYMTFGYFGELYRNLPWIENLKKNCFTIDEYIDDYFMQQVSLERLVKSANIDYVEFRNHIRMKMVNLCNRYGIDPDRINVEEYRYLYLEYLRVGCSIMLNLVNKMRYISYPIAEDDVYKYCSLSCKDNIGAKFMLDMYCRIYKPVLDIPFFTHCEVRLYNEKTGVLEPPASETYFKIIRRVKCISRFLPTSFKLWILCTFITKDKKALKDSSKNNYIDEIVCKYVQPRIFNNLEFNPFIHRNYIYLSMLYFALNKNKV